MSVELETICRVPAFSGRWPRPSHTDTGEKVSSQAGGTSTLATPESTQPPTCHGYNQGSRSQHRRGAFASGEHSRSRPSCVRAGKRTRGRLEDARFPAPLSKCLSRARSHRNDPIPDTLEGNVTDEKASFHPVCFSAKRNCKLSAFVGEDGAISIPVSSIGH